MVNELGADVQEAITPPQSNIGDDVNAFLTSEEPKIGNDVQAAISGLAPDVASVVYDLPPQRSTAGSQFAAGMEGSVQAPQQSTVGRLMTKYGPVGMAIRSIFPEGDKEQLYDMAQKGVGEKIATDVAVAPEGIGQSVARGAGAAPVMLAKFAGIGGGLKALGLGKTAVSLGTWGLYEGLEAAAKEDATVGSVAGAAAKGVAMGAALGTADKIIKFTPKSPLGVLGQYASEVGAGTAILTGVGAAADRKLPTAEEVAANGILIAGLKAPGLIKSFSSLGKAPAAQKVIEDAIKIAEEKLENDPVTVKDLSEEANRLGEYGTLPSPTLDAAGNISSSPPSKEIVAQPSESVQKVLAALKEAAPLNREQQKLYSAERGKRIKAALATGEKVSGEAGFYAELSKLKGELPKVQFESIRSKITQSDVDDLFMRIKDSPDLTDFEKIAARGGLAKLFGAYGGNVPQAKQLTLLNKVFGDEFVAAALDKRPLFQKFMNVAEETLNVPRAVMASFDLSAPFRQGAFMAGRPKQFIPAFGEMFKYVFSEKTFQNAEKEITSRPRYPLMQESGLAITEMGKNLGAREERFMSNYAEKIPVLGRGIRASERAYVGFLNKLRADVFDDLISKAEIQGRTPASDPELVKGISRFINAATGRGGLGKLEEAAVVMNTVFFSPRLMASRLTLLNPLYYVKQDPFVRKEALKTLVSSASVGLTVLGLSKLMGAEVQVDPRSSDFGKIKIGKNTRVDPWGGFQQWVRLGAQLITGKVVSTSGGKEIVLGEGYKPLTRLDIIQRSFEYKTAPVISFALDMLRGQSPFGEKLNIPKEIGLRFVPMMVQDFYDLAQEDPRLTPLIIPAAFGTGTQTYEHQTKTKKGSGYSGYSGGYGSGYNSGY
jgi:hypothetical protein